MRSHSEAANTSTMLRISRQEFQACWILKAENTTTQSQSLKATTETRTTACVFIFTYDNPQPGKAHYIHTYKEDGNPLPSYEGEPAQIEIEGDIDTFTNSLWSWLNEQNKVSLFVRYIDIKTGKYETRIINKNK